MIPIPLLSLSLSPPHSIIPPSLFVPSLVFHLFIVYILYVVILVFSYSLMINNKQPQLNEQQLWLWWWDDKHTYFHLSILIPLYYHVFNISLSLKRRHCPFILFFYSHLHTYRTDNPPQPFFDCIYLTYNVK